MARKRTNSLAFGAGQGGSGAPGGRLRVHPRCRSSRLATVSVFADGTPDPAHRIYTYNTCWSDPSPDFVLFLLGASDRPRTGTACLDLPSDPVASRQRNASLLGEGGRKNIIGGDRRWPAGDTVPRPEPGNRLRPRGRQARARVEPRPAGQVISAATWPRGARSSSVRGDVPRTTIFSPLTSR